MKNGKPRGSVLMNEAEPHYFEFFKIPFSGKLVDKDAQGFVYISKQFKEQLQRDSIAGSVTLDGKEYRIAGTYRALNREDTQSSSVGSVFLVNPQAYTYYFKTLHSDITPVALEKITEICRRYVPETLPLDIRNMGDSKQSVMGTVALLQTASLLLAIVSILLLILSIYSGISMDVVNRQKEVAIRKINGATPKVIALLFGKIYLIIYLSVFVIIYPLVRLVLIGIAQKSSLKSIYSWNWGILLFFTMAAQRCRPAGDRVVQRPERRQRHGRIRRTRCQRRYPCQHAPRFRRPGPDRPALRAGLLVRQQTPVVRRRRYPLRNVQRGGGCRECLGGTEIRRRRDQGHAHADRPRGLSRCRLAEAPYEKGVSFREGERQHLGRRQVRPLLHGPLLLQPRGAVCCQTRRIFMGERQDRPLRRECQLQAL